MQQRNSEQGRKIPTTIAELITALSEYAGGSRLSFAPFNLSHLTEDNGTVHFEMRETEDVDFTLLKNRDG